MDALFSAPYLPGLPPARPGPLARFLPPLEEGAVSAWLEGRVPRGAWLLDPFASSPLVPLEAARAGYRVLVSAGNPVTRFLLEFAADPPPAIELTAALSALGSSRRAEEKERLEAQIQSWYQTECSACGRTIPARAFVWRRDADAPHARLYTCPACGQSGEFPVTPADVERAAEAARRAGPPRGRVLARVAPPDDPDREHAAEALTYYPPRAVYALATLINRMEGLSLPPARRRALTALLLPACDAASVLWSHPVPRPRPRALSVPSEYLEHNVWLALEDALAQWTLYAERGGVPLVNWPNRPPESGGICLFGGRLKELAEIVRQAPLQAVIAALPRPNQAFWTFSALWAGWLWGPQTAAEFKIGLRRKRYDWHWHVQALQSVLHHVFDITSAGLPMLTFLPEPEMSFLAAALIAAQSSGFALETLAWRAGLDAMQLTWTRRPDRNLTWSDPDPGRVTPPVRHLIRLAGEPVHGLRAQAVVLAGMAAQGGLIRPGQAVEDALTPALKSAQAALEADPELIFLEESGGLWGLRAPDEEIEPLPDRVEMEVVRFLQKNPGATLLEIQRELHPRFPGLLTPPVALLRAVLESYAVEAEGRWSLRAEDAPAARRADLETAAAQLAALGRRLGCQEHRIGPNLLLWEQGSRVVYACYLIASAVVFRLARENPYPRERSLLALPGGRAGLLAYKLRRDPLLRERLRGWRFLKFRLIRSLLDISDLTLANFDSYLASDPIQQGPQQLTLL